MHQHRLEQWQEIEKVSQQMRDLAMSNQLLAEFSSDEDHASLSWKEVASLDVKRVELIQQFFDAEASADEAEFLTHGIKQVLAFDKELADIGLALQKNISLTLSKVGHQHRAAVAYGNVQTG